MEAAETSTKALGPGPVGGIGLAEMGDIGRIHTTHLGECRMCCTNGKKVCWEPMEKSHYQVHAEKFVFLDRRASR